MSKRGFVPALGALSALTGVAISLFIPAQNEIARALGVDAAAGTGLVSAYFLGYGLGQSVWGPLSDRLGRRGPLAVAMAGFILASIVCATTSSFAVMLAARALQGGLAGAAPVIARALARDHGGNRSMASMLGTITALTSAAGLVAPLAGSALLAFGDWRLIFWAMVGLAVLITVLVFAVLHGMPNEHRRAASFQVYVRNMGRVLKLGPFVSGLALAATISVGYGAFVGSAVAIAQDFYHVTPQASGVLFMLTGIAFMIGSLSARFVVARVGVERMLLAGCALAVVGSLPLALPEELPLAGFWLVICLYLTGFGVVAPLGFAKALEPAAEAAGAASSLLGTITTLTNAAGAALAASGLIGGLYDTLRILLLGSASLCLVVQVATMLYRRRARAADRVRP